MQKNVSMIELPKYKYTRSRACTLFVWVRGEWSESFSTKHEDDDDDSAEVV